MTGARAIRVCVAWEGGAVVFTGPLGEFLAANSFAPEEETAILGAIEARRPYQGGGGAAPLFTIMILLADREPPDEEDDDEDESGEPPPGEGLPSGIDGEAAPVPMQCGAS